MGQLLIDTILLRGSMLDITMSIWAIVLSDEINFPIINI